MKHKAKPSQWQSTAEVMKELLPRLELIKQQEKSKAAGSTCQRSFNCPKCKDEGGYFKVAPYKDSGIEVETWIECECTRNRRNEHTFVSGHITPTFSRMTFTNFKTVPHDCVQHAYKAAIQYVASFPFIHATGRNSIAILGKPGCGKTHLLTAIANTLMAQGTVVHYFPWVEGWNDIRSNMDDLARKIRHMQTVPVLFVDDVFKGREKPTEFQLEQFFAIVNYRYLNHKPMLISSEWTFAAMRDTSLGGDEALGSRISERCGKFTVLMQGDGINYRLREEE